MDRRSMMAAGLLGLTAEVAASGVAAPAESRPNAQTRASLEQRLQRLEDWQTVANIMSRYELLLGLGYLQEALELFALRTPDVKADVGFGVYEGAASLRRLYLGLHKLMIGDRHEPATLKPGGMYILTNTTAVIEVAEDGATAKGLWVCPGFSTRVDTDKKDANAIWGYCKRATDFIKEDGQWKIWHYQVYGVFYTPFDKAWTETDNAANLNFSWIPREMRPDRPSTTARDTMYDVKKPVPAVPKPPVPYRTFAETFAYL